MHAKALLLLSLATCILCADIPILNQFQDSTLDGQYKYGYQSGVESKSEQRTADGRTIGSYSYLDKEGKLQHVRYSAGIDGFKVLTSDTPAPSQFVSGPQQLGSFAAETPEVEAARRRHQAAYEAALRQSPKIQEHAPHFEHFQRHFQGPLARPVLDSQGLLVDTPEVSAAKAQHAAAHAEVRKILPVVPQTNQGPQISFPSLHHTPQFDFPQTRTVTKFAEEIPRNALGETPEVAAAKEAHFAFYAKVKAQLPDNNKSQFPF
ncbi:hypothetical protein PPYR_07084 [Photinus pyralis]|uniref:Cuticle protein 6 n=1 Tax=Photinus pyralis TaxID=7054 RepID=A0A5N4APG1_PHOPY|nr:uncharacterized protein LOC116168977 [Photinus pyralis]KAB0799204.1 hypothetical protein PPYR_07084 [Photinus pyralis]